MHKTVYLPTPCYYDDPLLKRLRIEPGKLWFPFTGVSTADIKDQHDLAVSVLPFVNISNIFERKLSQAEISALEAALSSCPEDEREAFETFLKKTRARQRYIKADERICGFLQSNPRARRVLVRRNPLFYLADRLEGKNASTVSVHTSSKVEQVQKAADALARYLAAERNGVTYDWDENCVGYATSELAPSSATHPLDFLVESMRGLRWKTIKFS